MRLFQRNPVRDALAIGVVLAVLLAGWLGVTWVSMERDPAMAVAQERDVALAAAESGLRTLHTMDHRRVEQDLDAWEQATDGALHRELSGDRDGLRTKAESRGTVSSADVVAAALTALDPHAGTARVIAVLDVRLDAAEQEGETQRRRMNAELRRGEHGWRIISVEGAS